MENDSLYKIEKIFSRRYDSKLNDRLCVGSCIFSVRLNTKITVNGNDQDDNLSYKIVSVVEGFLVIDTFYDSNVATL